MAEPGDPDRPDAPDVVRADPLETPQAAREAPVRADDPDDLVGFVSPASLIGHSRSAPSPKPEPELRVDPLETPVQPEAPEPALDASPAWARETAAELAAPRAELRTESRTERTFGARTPPPEGVMGLFTIYALILFAVPTLGVSALIGLLAVTGRDTPDDPLAQSHAVYQRRTLWTAAVVALAGAILVVVNLGVFILFVLAIWLMVRGAWGVFRLKAGRPIDNPRHWLI